MQCSLFGRLRVGLTWIAPRVSGQIFVGTPTPQQFTGQGHPSTQHGEWPANNADLKGTRYQPAGRDAR